MKVPANIARRHVVGAGPLEEIGFTMSIFVTNLAFTKQAEIINASKMATLIAVFDSRVLGFFGSRCKARRWQATSSLTLWI